MPKNKERNPCTFFIVAVLIINDGNKMDQFYNIKDIVKGSINKFILNQIGIIRVNGVENNMVIRSKRRLICHMGWCQPPPLILYLFIFPYIRKTILIIGLKSLSLGFLFIFFYWSWLEGAGIIFRYLLWMILSILQGVYNDIGYVYLYFSMINKYFVS